MRLGLLMRRMACICSKNFMSKYLSKIQSDFSNAAVLECLKASILLHCFAMPLSTISCFASNIDVFLQPIYFIGLGWMIHKM